MAEIVRMPKLSDTMTEGTVAQWHKKVGDNVKEGDLLAEIETDKATMEFESFQDGVLLYIGVEKGKAAPVDSILAILGKKGEDIQGLLDAETSGSSTEASNASASEEKIPKPKVEPTVAVTEALEVKATPATTTTPVLQSSLSSKRVIASPLAKKMAEEKGIDIHQVMGSGDGGRIVKRDIDNFTPSNALIARKITTGKESFRDEPLSNMRKTIARRLAESKFTSPHFYLTVEIDMDNAIAARNAINEQQEEAKISFHHLITKAAALALRKHPKVNSSWMGDFIRYNNHIHIGMAVAVPEGLLVPVIRFADERSLIDIALDAKELGQKAKDKKLQPQDWEGNTFTISNLGMMGIEQFTAIINPPEACIMAVGATIEKPVVKNGQIVVGHTMKVTLSCDHRVVDGALGAEFLQTFKKIMENPLVHLAIA